MDSPPMENEFIMNLINSYGPILLGALFSCVLWGISCMQLFLYFHNYASDHWGLKTLVLTAWVLDTVNECLTIAGMFPVMILKWGSLRELANIQSPLKLHTWIAGMVAFVVQMFFVHRIHKFNRTKATTAFLLFIVVPVALWQIVGSIIYLAWIFQVTSLAVLSTPRVLGLEISLRAASAFVDITIAMFMAYLLASDRRRSSAFRRSNQLMHNLIVLTINSGFWTAVIALVDLALVAAFPNGLQFCALEFPLSPLYVNMLLGNLNARRFLRPNNVNNTTLEFNSYELGASSNRDGQSNSAIRNISAGGSERKGADTQGSVLAIHVDTTVATHTSSDDQDGSTTDYKTHI